MENRSTLIALSLIISASAFAQPQDARDTIQRSLRF